MIDEPPTGASPAAQDEALAGFAERLLEVIDTGRRTATYKLALLLAMIDLCTRQADSHGLAPDVLYTRDLAERVVALYWPQVRPYGSAPDVVLRQISGQMRATIIEAVRALWLEAKGGSLSSARHRLPDSWLRTVDMVEVVLAEQPLPRLQTVGDTDQTFPFLYDLGWSARQSISLARLRRHGPRGAPVRLRPGVGDQLLRLAPLVRPFVELHWVRLVARHSGLDTETERLHRHLFGAARVTLPTVLREGLDDLQRGRCFYCDRGLGTNSDADHLIPRVRGGDDAIENLVLADSQCNNNKRDLLAAPLHVTRWVARNRTYGNVLGQLAASVRWPTDPRAALAAARSVYGHLPGGIHPFWAGVRQVEAVDAAEILAMLAAEASPG